MLKLAIAGAVAVTLLTVPARAVSTTEIVDEVQKVATSTCDFFPAASSILLILVSHPAVSGGAVIGKAICAAVEIYRKGHGHYRRHRVHVYGIRVKGRFV